MLWPIVLLGGYSLFSKSLAANSLQCELRSPVNQTACGYKGALYADTDYIGELQTTASVAACASYCARRGGLCKTFFYDTSNKFCGLIGETEIDRTKKGTRSFYGVECFDCGDPCDQDLGVQTLDNGRFHNEFFGPWYSEAGHLVRTNGGSYAWQSLVGSKASKKHILKQAFNSCTEKLYKIRFDYKFLEGEKAGREFVLTSIDDSLVYTVKGLGGSSVGEWQREELWVRKDKETPYYQDPEIVFDFGRAQNEGPGKVNKNILVDNVFVSRFADNPQTKAGAKSLITNGDFETGDLAPWTSKGETQVVSPGINSTYGLQMNRTLDEIVEIVQTLTTKPGTTYVFSYDYSAECTNCLVTVNPYGGARVLEFTGHFEGPDQGHYVMLFKARSNNTPLRVQFLGLNASILLDNFSLKELAS